MAMPLIFGTANNLCTVISVILPDAPHLTIPCLLRYNFCIGGYSGIIGGVAQLGERLTGSQEVMGSIPTVSTILKTAYSCE